MKTNIIKRRSMIFALMGVFLMVSGVFVLIPTSPQGVSLNLSGQSGQGIQVSPDLASVGETASTSTAVSYYDSVLQSNSGTSTVTLPATENSTYTSSSVFSNFFSIPNTWTLQNANTETSISETVLNSAINEYFQAMFWTQSNTYTVKLQDLAFFSQPASPSSFTSPNQYMPGSTIYVNLTLTEGTNTYTFPWSTSVLGSDSSSNARVTYVNPSWDVYPTTPQYELFAYASITITLQAPSGYVYYNTASDSSSLVVTNTSQTGTTYTTETSDPNVNAVPFEIGANFASATASWSYPSNFLSEDIVTENAQYPTSATYNGATESVPYTFTASSGQTSITFANTNDPAVTGIAGYTVQYYFDNIYYAETASTTETSSPAYTYTQVSGTTNEASASFSFSASTPSGAIFSDYGGTLAETFTPAITISNPYYSFSQNQLVASLSGASTGSSTTSSTASPSFTGNSVSYTTSTSPSWTVNLNLYGNRHPTYQNSAISLTTVNPLTPIDLYANFSEYFSGEPQTIQSTWNGHALVSSSSSTTALEQTSDFKNTGIKTISFYSQNTPDPATNGLSSLNSGSSSFSVNVIPFSLSPSPVDYSSVGASALLSLKFNTQTAAEMSQIDVTVNGVLQDRFQPNEVTGTVQYDFSQPVSAPLLVTWTATDQYGYSQSMTFQYGSNLTPAEYSNKVTVLQSANATHSYPISLSGVPNGTGFYQQLITISNPSSYGINKAGSNIQFTAQNGTLLYAWIQSINSTSMQVWIKNYYGNSVIDMQVLPSFENLFSANGYLGEAPELSTIYAQNDNGRFVFTDYWNFSGTSVPNGLEEIGNTSQIVIDNGLTINPSSAGTEALIQSVSTSFNPSSQGAVFLGWMNGTQDDWSQSGWNMGGNHQAMLVSSAGTGYYRIESYNGSAAAGATTTIPIGTPTLWTVAASGTASFVSMNNSLFSVAQPNPTGSSYIYTTVYADQVGSTHLYSMAVRNFITGGLGSMPTFTIGTGSTYQANATTTSSFTGTPAGDYNTTYVFDTYDIPLAPTTSYVTVEYNSSWTVSNIYPSTYLPLIPSSDFLTIENIKGFGSVQVTFIEPSQNIGTTTFQSIQYQMPTGINPPVNYFNNIIDIRPFDSTTTSTEQTTSQYVEIPYGATISVSVHDPWGDSVGEVNNYVVGNITGAIIIPLNVTELQFEFFNSTENYVYLSHNGINESFFNSALVANGTVFSWSTSYYSFSSSKEEIKSGSVETDTAIQPLLIYMNAPIGELQVSVFAYSGSNLGAITDSGNPRVLAFINGQNYSIGSTFTGYQGSTYEIRIADLLNQTLLETNITLQSPLTSITETITAPSYWMGIENDEAVPQNSPLATEYMSINLTGTHHWYNFTDSVDQNWIGYFLAGNYTLYMHDNVTNTFTVNLSVSNQQFYLNGQALLNYSDFKHSISQLLNNTSGLTIGDVASSSGVQPGQVALFSIDAFYANGTQVSTSFLQNSTIDVFIHNNANGNLVSLSTTTTISSGIANIQITPSTAGSYEVNVIVVHGTVSGVISFDLNVQNVVIISKGMILEATGPSDVAEFLTWNYTIAVDYSNGTAMSLNNTKAVFDNMTFTIFNGIDPIQQIEKISYGAGYILINATFNQTGGFTVYLKSNANLNGYASATALIPVQVYASSKETITSQIAFNSQILTDTSNSLMVGLSYANGTFLSSSLTQLLYNNATLNIYTNGIFYESLNPTSYSTSIIFFNVNLSTPGNYTFEFQTHANGLSTLSVSNARAVKVYPSLEGLHMEMVGASQLYVGESGNFTISLTYSNGTSLNLADTESVYLNLTYAVLDGLDPTYNIHLLGYSAGLIFFSYYSNITGIFSLYMESHANLNGYASATALIPVSVENISYGLHVTPLSPSISAIPGQNISIIFSVTEQNYSSVTLYFLQHSSYSVVVTSQNGTVHFPYTIEESSGNITVKIDNVSAGNYTVALTITNGKYSGSGFYSFISAQPVKSSSGLIFILLSPSNNEIQVSTHGNITMLAEYGNHTLLNLTDSRMLITGGYIQGFLYENNQFIGTVIPTLKSAGTFLIPYDFKTVASYMLYVSAKGVPIGQINVSATTYTDFSVVAFNPTAPPLTGLNSYLYALINNLSLVLGLIISIGAILVFGYRRIRRNDIKKANFINQIKQIIIAVAIYRKNEKQADLIYSNVPVAITEDVEGAVLHPQAKMKGFDYVMAANQIKKIQKERKKGDM